MINKIKGLTTKQRIMLIIGVGLVIRLILMPFVGHEDIMLTNGRAYSIAFDGVNLFSINQQISHLIEAINLKIYSIFFDFQEMQPFSTSPVENPYVLRHLFVFKLPYLIFDLIAAWLILKLSDNKHRIYALAFYFLNPILIFAVYVFSRYETIPIVFLLLALWLLKQKKLLWSSLAMGLSLLARSSMLMVLPFYWMTVGKNWKQKIMAILVSVIPYAGVLLYQMVGLGSTNELEFVADGKHTNYLLGLKLNINEVIDANFYPLIAIYGVLLFLAFQVWQSKKQDWKTTAGFFGLGFALYYVLGFYNPQYLAWITPFVALILMDRKYRKTTLWAFAGIVAAFPFMLLLWGQPMLMGFFRPISEELGTKDLGGVIGHFYNQYKLADLGRSFMSGMYGVVGFVFYRFVSRSD